MGPKLHSSVRSASLVVILGFAGCGDSGPPVKNVGGGFEIAPVADSPAILGRVPAFELTDSSGSPFGSDELAGNPWIASLLFTTCSGPCPQVASSLAEMQHTLKDSDVRLVTITVDPEYDTPEVLADYASHYGATPERWVFLTGVEQEIYELVRGGLSLAVDRLPENEAQLGVHVSHATRLVVVDGDANIRGWYDARDEDLVEKCVERALYLDRNPTQAIAASSDH